MAFKNIELRVYKGNISFAEIGAELGVAGNTISRWFNQGEMNEVQKRRVEMAVDQIKERKAKE